jgi:ElaB/YqjD/DUF883 family membrane-anchored ribosome-binding protein
MGERTDPLSHESPAEIRRDIADTQREMSHTIDEIQYRLSPAHMKAQARESVRRAGVSTTRGTIDRVKSNPLGAAMVGVGLYLLMRPSHDDHDYEMHFTSDFDAEPGRMSGAVDDVRERASHVMDEAGERARMMRDRAAHRAHTASMQSRDLLMDNPLVGGLAAIALGALVGAMIPESRRENELMGEASDRITERVSDVARSGVDQAKNIATAATTAAKDAATDAARRETKNAKDELTNQLGRG